MIPEGWFEKQTHEFDGLSDAKIKMLAWDGQNAKNISSLFHQLGKKYEFCEIFTKLVTYSEMTVDFLTFKTSL